ncbi:MAG: YjfB family protein [Oscillospiraceae bacterium]
MDIAAMSMSNSLQSLQSAISMVMLRKTMNQDAQAADALLQGLSNQPPVFQGEIGSLLDIKA